MENQINKNKELTDIATQIIQERDVERTRRIREEQLCSRFDVVRSILVGCVPVILSLFIGWLGWMQYSIISNNERFLIHCGELEKVKNEIRTIMAQTITPLLEKINILQTKRDIDDKLTSILETRIDALERSVEKTDRIYHKNFDVDRNSEGEKCKVKKQL